VRGASSLGRAEGEEREWQQQDEAAHRRLRVCQGHSVPVGALGQLAVRIILS
jgi:hypothetical protein